MFRIQAQVDGKWITLANVPLRDEEDQKVSSTGKTKTIAYHKEPISYKGQQGYVSLTAGVRIATGEAAVVELG